MNWIPVFQPASPQAHVILDLFVAILILCGVILLIVTAAIAYCLMRFRAQPGAQEPRQIVGNRNLEVLWTVIPILLVVWIFVLTARAMHRSDPDPADEQPDLIVVGHQWWWEARYPKSGAITANEIHIPTGRRLLLRLEAADVIHDFWVPQLARKMDMVPGHPNSIWLQADRPGTYLGACAEFCGAQHAWMRLFVIAQRPVDFDIWQRQQARPAPSGQPAGQGAQLFLTMTCANCHAIRGTPALAQVAPDLTHLADRQTIAAGLLSNTATNLQRWLKDPQDFKASCLMPNLQLTDSQAAALASYLESLK
jgi:cytochrome c oxidase subunit 2